MKNLSTQLLSLMVGILPCVSSASINCDYNGVTKYDLIFYSKASKLEYRPASKNRAIFSDITSNINSIEKSLYQFAQLPKHAIDTEIGFIDVPNKGKFFLVDGEAEVKKLNSTRIHNNIVYSGERKFNNPELYDFLAGDSFREEKYYYLSGQKSRSKWWTTSEYLVNGKPVLLNTDFLIVLRPLAAKITRVMIYEVNPNALVGAAYGHDLSNFLPKKGCDWRNNLAPTIQDQIDILNFIQNIHNKAQNDDALPIRLKNKIMLRRLVNENKVQMKNLKLEKNKIKVGELIHLTFDIHNDSDRSLSASMISNYWGDNRLFSIDYRLSGSETHSQPACSLPRAGLPPL